ncbi:urease accessory protein UreE [Pseudogemmobacter sonorensis]|uniref:urease accessory protein UreE n=1 Tax=Pseudogemmobacter sonorensis TaxID=2989681 RepID=UPI0036C4B39E
MADLPLARDVLKEAPDQTYDLVVLGYDERLLRRKRLVTVHGEGFLVDLPVVTNLDDFWGFRLLDGRAIQVVAAEEALVEVTGPDLLRYAWHIGNRHTPCQIEPKRLLIRADHVLEAMLSGLGAGLTPVSEPFTPEGGAYGHGRTMGHSHGDEHRHEHGHAPGGAQAPTPGGEALGWHDHGDGRLHYHPPARPEAATQMPPLPYGHRDAK